MGNKKNGNTLYIVWGSLWDPPLLSQQLKGRYPIPDINNKHSSKACLVLFFLLIFLFIRYFLYLHFKCYPESSLYPLSTLLHYPSTPASWPWHSPILGHIKFAIPRGLSSQWWPTRPSSATYAARDMSSGGYWLVHIVVPPIGLQTPSAPWVLSLDSPLGALCSIL